MPILFSLKTAYFDLKTKNGAISFIILPMQYINGIISMLTRFITSILRFTLVLIEKWFEVTRKTSTPPFPYDKSTKKISLPKNIEQDLHRLVLAGNKAEAVKKVTELTGASLRVSKDYVDTLAKGY